jgi:competence protein ComEC
MRTGTLAFLIGVLLFQQLATLPSLAWAWGLVLCVPAGLWLKPFWHLPAWLLGGFLWSLISAHQILAVSLPENLIGKDVVLEGQIASLPTLKMRHVQFEFAVKRAWAGEKAVAVPGRIRLNWFQGYPTQLRAGDTWRLQVRLKPPHGFRNPGGFDYEAWLMQHRIRATGYVRQSDQNQILATGWAYPLQRLRQAIRSQVSDALDDSPGQSQLKGVLLALVIGDRSAISPEQWQTLQRTGTNHLMAISGLHIGLVAGLAFWLGQRLWRYSGRGMLWLPAPKVGAILALTAAAVYAALAGFSIPTQRALIMVAVIMLALLASRPVIPTRILATALLLVLLFDPLAVLASGFWLSFAAVAIIFYGLSGRLGRLPRWYQGVRVQWWISVGLFPLVIVLFQRASLISPVANLLAVPLVSLLVVPLALLGTLFLPISHGLGETMLQLAAWLMHGIMLGLAWLAEWPLASWAGAATSGWQAALAVCGVILLLAPRGLPARSIGLVLLLPLVVGMPSAIPLGAARFTLLDVGQGLAAVVETRHHTLVFDTGPRFSPRFDTGEAVVVPYLRQRGLRHVDRLVISHGDSDHIGGAESILAAIQVADISSSVPEKLAPRPVTGCRRGQRWEWDGVVFAMLHPTEGFSHRRNNASCVLKVTAGNHTLLLTGDIEKAAEHHLLQADATDLQADILVAPHHGSNTSSTMPFIRAVAPDYVLFPVGYRNRFRFPRQAVVQRYREQGVTMLATASAGAISFQLGQGTIQPSRFRQSARRYWHDR